MGYEGQLTIIFPLCILMKTKMAKSFPDTCKGLKEEKEKKKDKS